SYVLLEVRHKASQDIALATNAVWSSNYGNDFEGLIVDNNNPFRPPRTTEWPSIKGAMNAIVDGSGDGSSAEVDKLGRYKVRLPLDRSDASGGEASRYMRMAQPNAGKNMGMQFPLYPGTEVILTHVDGDPDRPIISGALANVDTPSPVGEGNETDAVIQTPAGRIALCGDPEHPQTVLQSDRSQIRFGSGSANFTYMQSDCFCENNAYMKNVLAGCDSDMSSYFSNDTMVGFPLHQFLSTKLFEVFETGLSLLMDGEAELSDKRKGDAADLKIQEKKDAANNAYVDAADIPPHENERDYWKAYLDKLNEIIPLKKEWEGLQAGAAKNAKKSQVDTKIGQFNALTVPTDPVPTGFTGLGTKTSAELTSLRDTANTNYTAHDTWVKTHHSDERRYAEEMAEAVSLSDDEQDDVDAGVTHSAGQIGFKAGITFLQIVENIGKAITLFFLGKKLEKMIEDKIKLALEPAAEAGPHDAAAEAAQAKAEARAVAKDLAEELAKTATEMIPFGTLGFTIYRIIKECVAAKKGSVLIFNPEDYPLPPGQPVRTQTLHPPLPDPLPPLKTKDTWDRLDKEAFKVVRKAGRLLGATVVAQAHDGENIVFQTEIGDIRGQAGKDVHFSGKQKFIGKGLTTAEVSTRNAVLEMVPEGGVELRYGLDKAPTAPGTSATKRAKLVLGGLKKPPAAPVTGGPPLPPPGPATTNDPPPPDPPDVYNLELSVQEFTGAALPGGANTITEEAALRLDQPLIPVPPPASPPKVSATLEAQQVVVQGGEMATRASKITLVEEQILLANGTCQVAVAGGTTPAVKVTAGSAVATILNDGLITLESSAGVILSQNSTSGSEKFVEIDGSGNIKLSGGTIEISGTEIKISGTLKDQGGTEIMAPVGVLSSQMSSAQSKIDQLTSDLKDLTSQMEKDVETTRESAKESEEKRKKERKKPNPTS
ncbi:MAG: phage baseplate assembly protein V, partial [Planctomycetota bacterium]